MLQQLTKAVVALRPTVVQWRQPTTAAGAQGQSAPFLAGRPKKAEQVATDHHAVGLFVNAAKAEAEAFIPE